MKHTNLICSSERTHSRHFVSKSPWRNGCIPVEGDETSKNLHLLAHLRPQFQISSRLRLRVQYGLTAMTVPWKDSATAKCLASCLQESAYASIDTGSLTPDRRAKVWPIVAAWIMAIASAPPRPRCHSHCANQCEWDEHNERLRTEARMALLRFSKILTPCSRAAEPPSERLPTEQMDSKSNAFSCDG